MKKKSRLIRQRDFQAVLAGRRAYRGRCLVAFGRASEGSGVKVGVAASRRIKGAVRRNRARRRLREAARLWLASNPIPKTGAEVVLIGREEAYEAPFEELAAQVGLALKNVLRRS